MSLTSVLPYFRARAKTFGWKEWPEPFHDDNVPATLLDTAFHLKWKPSSGSKTNQVDTEVSVPVEVKLYQKGFKDPNGGRDKAIASAESFIKECLKTSNRLTQPTLKNVVLQSLDLSGFGDNSNLVTIAIGFQATVIVDTT